MKFTVIVILLLLSFTLISQSFPQDIDRIVSMYKFKLKIENIIRGNEPSKKNLKVFNDLNRSILSSYANDSLKVSSYLTHNLENGNRQFEKRNYDSAYAYYVKCIIFITECDIQVSFKYRELYQSAYYCSISNSTDSNLYNKRLDYFRKSILYGNDNIDDLLQLYQVDKSLPEDSIQFFFNKMNANYITNRKFSDLRSDNILRYIYFMDQYPRVKYIHKLIPFSEVQKNDSLIQLLFITVYNTINNLNCFDGSYYQKTFDLLLTHFASNPERDFFEKYFCKYAEAFGNDFKSNNNLTALMDLYLTKSINKQYFNTDYGQGNLPDNNWGMLPKLNENELLEVFKHLNINSPIYK